MTRLIPWLDGVLYRNYGSNWDTRLLRELVDAAATSGSVVLDLGAGTGRLPEMDLRGTVRRVVGVDPDAGVLSNPFLDEAHQATGDCVPIADDTFDLVVSNNVLEHLARPAETLAEVRRVLKPGGRLIAKTPNRRHYVAAIARLTPHRFHAWVNQKRGRATQDTFPTLYRANTPATIRRLAAASGLKVIELRLVEGRPEYLRLTAPTYLLGWLYERLVNRVGLLAGLRAVMLIQLAKPLRATADASDPSEPGFG